MGIDKNDKELVSFDKDKIDQFREGIEFMNGYYSIEIPWFEDKVSLVPSNHFIALKILDKTTDHLKKKDILDRYEDVFNKQLKKV